MVNNLLFSVIIPTCHRPEQLQACLNRLQAGAQSLDAAAYEVIVTDDSKDETTASLLSEQYRWVQYTRGPQRGPAANRNHGARLAKGEWLVFTDDDCLPDARWLDGYALAIQQHADCLAFEGAVRPDRPRQSAREVAPINEAGGVFWSCNIAVAKSLFEQVNGFDEKFLYPHMEDIDLYKRLSILTPISFIPKAKIVHPWRPLQQPAKLIKYHESFVYFTSKWTRKSTKIVPYLNRIIRARLTPIVKMNAWSEVFIALHEVFMECIGVALKMNSWNKKYR